MSNQPQVKDVYWLHKAYFDDPTLSDLRLKLSDGINVHVHRIVLCRRSEYFDKLITKGFKETDAKEIELHDDEPSAVLAMLRFLYDLPYAADEAHWHDGKTMLPHAQVYTVAEKYGIESLKYSAHKTMQDLFLQDNITDLLLSIREIMIRTPQTDYLVRDLVVGYCSKKLVALSKDENSMALLYDFGELGAALITQQVANIEAARNHRRSRRSPS